MKTLYAVLITRLLNKNIEFFLPKPNRSMLGYTGRSGDYLLCFYRLPLKAQAQQQPMLLSLLLKQLRLLLTTTTDVQCIGWILLLLLLILLKLEYNTTTRQAEGFRLVKSSGKKAVSRSVSQPDPDHFGINVVYYKLRTRISSRSVCLGFCFSLPF